MKETQNREKYIDDIIHSSSINRFNQQRRKKRKRTKSEWRVNEQRKTKTNKQKKRKKEVFRQSTSVSHSVLIHEWHDICDEVEILLTTAFSIDWNLTNKGLYISYNRFSYVIGSWGVRGERITLTADSGECRVFGEDEEYSYTKRKIE